MEHKREYIKKVSTDGSYGFGIKFVIWENNTFPDSPKSISGGPQIAIFHFEADADEYIEFKNNQLKDKEYGK